MTTTFEDLRKRAAEAGAGGLRRELRKVLTGVAMTAERQAKLNATSRMRVRTGHLRRNIAATVVDGKTGGVEVRLGVQGVPYARIQEKGGTVVPRSAKALAIPMPAAQTAAGVGRYPSPRAHGNLQWRPDGKGGPGLLFDPSGVLMYVLKRQITIKPKWYLRDALTTATQDLDKQLSDAVEVVL